MASFSLSDHVFAAALDARALRSSPSCERRRLWATELPFLVCALAALEWLPAQRALNPLVCLLLIAGFAEASREGHAARGAGWAPSAQLAFVPMLFFAPLNLVPLMVLASYLATDMMPCLGHRRPAGPRVLCLGDGWWTLGPVIVLGAADYATFAWAHWPVYVAALAAQLALSTLFACLRVRLHDGEWLALRDVVGLPTLIDIILTLPALSIAAAAGDAPIGAALTWAALLAIAAGILSERGDRSTNRADKPTPAPVTPRVAARPATRAPRRATRPSTFVPRSHAMGAEASRSRRSPSCAARCLATRSKPTYDHRYSTAVGV
ncbi:MAG: hypothetical protein QOJ63_3137 [Solirubrobacteraceae bacterium]|nr:hypothetical protein [Solirubrobacteraceae bacterium]